MTTESLRREFRFCFISVFERDDSLTLAVSFSNMSATEMDLLRESAKLDRDRGLAALKRRLIDAESAEVCEIEKKIIGYLTIDEETSRTWETCHGMMGATNLILAHKHCSDNFADEIHPVIIKLLEHDESRVRIIAGEALGLLCARCGVRIYESNKDLILNGVKENLERKPESELTEVEPKPADDTPSTPEVPPQLKRYNSAEDLFHDTAGWKSLETWMICLQRVIEGCGNSFQPFIDQQLLDLVFEALHHTNRFVRETGYYVCGAIVGSAVEQDGKVVRCEENAVYKLRVVFSEQLARGLSDNWSQVRLAASVATRSLLQSIPQDASRDEFYSILLPRMCLNRYYVAEGVRIYSQETWRLVTGSDGRNLVGNYIEETVDYYVEQSDADNHAVREAACACIAELGSKINKETVRPYVGKLLDTLITCFKDDSWPVRDASCVACGNFILCFADEARDQMDQLWPLFFENLQDNISSVRQGAAVALANVCKAYGSDAMKRVYDKIREGFAGVEAQVDDVEKYQSLEKGPAVYSVVKKARDNDEHLHTDQTMYSCGSLAPKMGRGRREGGCMDHKFRRQAQPWELADGCVYLLAELSALPTEAQAVAKLLPALAKAAGCQHYTSHVHLLETVMKQLPIIGRGIGKRFFKMHVETFFDAIFYSHSCDNALTSSAASQCLNQLSSLLGPSILRGRVEQYNPKYLEKLDESEYIAAL